jgi:hypothetical protein
LRLLIITSCRGKKAVTHARGLTFDDFRRGTEHVAHRERELQELLTPAEALYTGQQQLRLMRGIRAIRDRRPDAHSIELSLWIVSAGYGLVPGDQKLAPYEATFQRMKPKELRSWADWLHIPARFREIVAKPCDLALVLLGARYLASCVLDSSVYFGGPAILFYGEKAMARLPKVLHLRVFPLSETDARTFSCGLVGLKGEIAGRLLRRVAAEPTLVDNLKEPSADLRGLIEADTGAR